MFQIVLKMWLQKLPTSNFQPSVNALRCKGLLQGDYK
jgi:hypothetical protein